jgi:hypothetical protein
VSGQFFRTQISWTQIDKNVVLRIVVQSEAMHRFGGRLTSVGKKRFKEESVGTMGILSPLVQWEFSTGWGQPVSLPIRNEHGLFFKTLFTNRCDSAAEAVHGLRLDNDS